MCEQNNAGTNDINGSVWEPQTIKIFGEVFTVELEPRVTPLAEMYDDPDRPDDPYFLVGINRKPRPGDDPLRQLFEPYRPELPEGPIYDHEAAARQKAEEDLVRDGVQMVLVGKEKTWTLSLAIAPPPTRGLPESIKRAPDGCDGDGGLRIRGVATYRDDPTDYYLFYIVPTDTADEDRIRIAVSQQRRHAVAPQRPEGTDDPAQANGAPDAGKTEQNKWTFGDLIIEKKDDETYVTIGNGKSVALKGQCRQIVNAMLGLKATSVDKARYTKDILGAARILSDIRLRAPFLAPGDSKTVRKKLWNNYFHQVGEGKKGKPYQYYLGLVPSTNADATATEGA